MELKELTINDLLKNFKLVIPEIQREYVWGCNKTVLEKFLSELNISFSTKSNSDSNIGFLYSYNPNNTADSNINEIKSNELKEHYIIDGQQRLTTIVLLLYFYSVKEGRKSDFEDLLNTSGTFMNFSYRVRPITEQFLITLFNDKKITEESFIKLKDSKWYVSDYDDDTTISSICELYEWVTNKDNINRFSNLNYDSLLNRVKFYYFDVQQTSQGEELYITMNSRGEQLKDNEQLKPYILEKEKNKNACAKAWEKWEEYFFEKLLSKDEEHIQNVDVAIENIIKIALELNTCGEHDKINAAEDSKVISFKEINKVYESISELITSFNDEIKTLEIEKFLFSKEREKQKLFAIEAIIRMLQLGFSLENENETMNIHRMLRLIRNSLNYGVMDHVPLLKFLASLGKSENIYNFINEKTKENPTVVEGVLTKGANREELYKIQAILDNKTTELEIEQIESLSVFNGQIHLLYRDATTTEISWKDFSKKVEKAKNWFNVNGEETIRNDKYIDFVHTFINSFNNWEQLNGSYFFDNTLKDFWHKYLTDYKYLVPLSQILINNSGTKNDWSNDNTRPIFNFFKDKKNITEIINRIPRGRLNWYSNHLCFYPYGGGNTIVFDWGDFKRNYYLTFLLEKNIISLNDATIKIGNVYIGWDIYFIYNKKEYVWNWQNQIKSGNEIVLSNPTYDDIKKLFNITD